MKTEFITAENIAKLKLSDFDLEQTLNCGQCFRWQKQEDGSFIGAAQNHAAKITQDGSIVTVISDADADFWNNYFDVSADYAAMKRTFSTVLQMQAPCEAAGKIRILRQDGWEAIASFILSQNNNIKRIAGIIERLCQTFGEPIGMGLYSFPRPERIADCSIDDLAPLRCGFRARYLIDGAKKVCGKTVDINSLYTLPLDDARAMLKKIVGVGNKVADCALLFGFYRLECFPVDVWIRRAVEEFFPDGLPDEILPYAGVAQQFIFHYMRTRNQA